MVSWGALGISLAYALLSLLFLSTQASPSNGQEGEQLQESGTYMGTYAPPGRDLLWELDHRDLETKEGVTWYPGTLTICLPISPVLR